MIHDTYANDSTALKIIYKCKTSFIKKADSFESALTYPRSIGIEPIT